MRYLPREEEVTLYETVFAEDILRRKKLSKTLSGLLERIEDPLVIALDGRWGTGKSYFLKRWVGAHKIQNDGKALTLYFDAFANDYLSDPLAALISALAARAPEKDRKKLVELKRVAFKFIRPIARIALNMATLGAKEALDDLSDAAADVVHGEGEALIAEYWRQQDGRHEAMQTFRDSLAQLVGGDDDAPKRPLVIVIDELDRCRPDYALEILEVMKHFFAVPFVHFVLGVNLNALENSLKARYGPQIDATAYLQKFISLTLALPDHVEGPHIRTPAALTYAEHTARAMQLPDMYVDEIVKGQLPGVLRRNSVSIRDVGKILGSIAILPEAALNQNLHRGWRDIAASMIIARVVRRDIFDKMVSASLSKDELVAYLDATSDRINKLLPGVDHNENFDHATWYTFRLWQLILSNGAEVFEGIDNFRNAFGRFVEVRRAGRIPGEIYRDWLSTFRTP